MPEVLTETDSTKFSDYLAEQMRDPEFAAAYKEVSAAEDAKLAEIRRLERAVLDAALEEHKMEHAADYGSNTITRTEALIKMQRAMKAKREACAALIDFESSQLKK